MKLSEKESILFQRAFCNKSVFVIPSIGISQVFFIVIADLRDIEGERYEIPVISSVPEE